MLIASPIGGHIAACKWADPVVSLDMDDFSIGLENTNQLIALGAQSPLGQAAQAYRTLTGIDDWYVPSINEIKNVLHTNRAVLPAGHEYFTPAAINWASTRYGNGAYVLNSSGVTTTVASQATNSYVSRLVRRIHRSEWVADEV